MTDTPVSTRIAPYARVTLVASFLTTALMFGVWFSFAVFLVAVLEDFGWSRAGASMAFSVGNLVQAALSPVIGMLTDRWGPRSIIVAGCLVTALGLAACSLVQALWHLMVAFGIVVGLGVALAGPVSHSALLASWFVHRRGTIIGFAFAGMGLGVKLLGPLAQYSVLSVGWRSTFLLLALLTVVYSVAIALVLRNTPQEVGLQPYRDRPLSASPSGHELSTTQSTQRQAWTVAQAVRTPEFWALFAVQIFIPLGIFPISVHQVAYLADIGFSKVFAAAILGHMGLMSSCGRVIFGALSDRLGRFGGVLISVIFSQIGIVVLILIQGVEVVWPLYVYALFFGLGYGARGPIVSATAADLFAGKNFATIFGLITIGHGIGGALGPWAGGAAYDQFGAYQPAFVGAFFALFGAVICFWIATRRLASS